MRRSIASLLLCAAAAFGDLHAQTTSVPFEGLTAQAPERTKLRMGRDDVGDVLIWRVNDPLSAYNGLTLVWIEIDDDDVMLSVDPRSGWDSMSRASLGAIAGDVVAVLSGGMWSGAYDAARSASRKPMGLVYASGQARAPLAKFPSTGAGAPQVERGGVLVSCDEQEVTVLPVTTFRALTRNAPLPCDADELRTASALQTSVILGAGQTATIARGAAANRLAIGSANKRIVVAGAFTASGFALPLQEFSRYIEVRMPGLTMLNLDGECSAQIYLPQIERRFGCPRAGFLVNRILLRHSDGH